MTNLIGQSLGRYHILEQLGEGGMAVVYRAYDTRLERNVAVKVILPHKQHTEKFIRRFEREAKALASLSHPNIVKVIDYGEHGGIPFLVMEYLPGGTLKQKLVGRRIPWQEAARILTPIAHALAYAHEHKIIHRDVKPSNILITDSGEPMLSDFGIAKILEAEETLDLTGTGVGVGTPEYMSPEQAQGKDVDTRSDVYSLGVVLYEMITGRKPYQADTPYAVAIKQVNEPLPRPKQFAPELPGDVEKVLLKALAKSPENRFLNMALLATVLETLNKNGKVRIESVPWTKQKQVLRRLLGLLIGLILVVSVASVMLLAQPLRQSPGKNTALPAAVVSTPTKLPTATRASTRTPTASPTSIPTSIPPYATPSSGCNFDFETMNSCWTISNSANYYVGSPSQEWASQGETSFKLSLFKLDPSCDIYSQPWDHVQITQRTDLTNVSAIVLDASCIGCDLWSNNRHDLYLEVRIDQKPIAAAYSISEDVRDYVFEIPEKSGSHQLTIRFGTSQTSCYVPEVGVYVDNIRFLYKSSANTIQLASDESTVGVSAAKGYAESRLSYGKRDEVKY